MELLFLLCPKHHLGSVKNRRIIQGAYFDDHSTRSFGRAASNMNSALSAEFSRGSVFGTFAFKATWFAGRVAETFGLDSDEQIASTAGYFLAGIAQANSVYLYLPGNFKSQRTTEATPSKSHWYPPGSLP